MTSILYITNLFDFSEKGNSRLDQVAKGYRSRGTPKEENDHDLHTKFNTRANMLDEKQAMTSRHSKYLRSSTIKMTPIPISPPEPESETTNRRSNKGMSPIRYGDEQAAWIPYGASAIRDHPANFTVASNLPNNLSRSPRPLLARPVSGWGRVPSQINSPHKQICGPHGLVLALS